MNRQYISALSIFAILLSSADASGAAPRRAAAPARPAAPAAAAEDPSCQGVGNNGSFARGIAKRDREKDQLCGENSPFKRALESIKQKIDVCKNLGRSVQGGSIPVNFSVFDDHIKKRHGAVCEAYKRYHTASKEICERYKKAKSDITAAARQIDGINDGAEATRFSRQQYTRASDEFRHLTAAARQAGAELDEQARGVKPAERDFDQQMPAFISSLKNTIKGQTDHLLQQANQSLAQRQRTAQGASEDGGQAIRFANDAQYRQFLKDLNTCRSLAQDNGELDKYNQAYQQRLAQEVAKARQEAADAQAAFQANQQEYLATANRARSGEQAVVSANLDRNPNATLRDRLPDAPIASPTARTVSADEQTQLVNSRPRSHPTVVQGQYSRGELVEVSDVQPFQRGGVNYRVYQRADGTRFAYPVLNR